VTRRPVAAAWAEAHAKVNLALAVTGRRPDGYHDLRSVFLRLELHDHLEVRLADGARGTPGTPGSPAEDVLVIDGPPGLSPRDNLVLRAITRLRAAIERPLPALAVRLDKHIPVAAGLGGGSSDAAAALELAARAWDVALDRAALVRLAAAVGSDVPFFASGHSAALVSGVGDIVDALPEPRPGAGFLLVTPPQPLSTPAVFAELDRVPTAGRGALENASDSVARVAALAATLGAGTDAAALAAAAADLRDANDLWAPAARLMPQLGLLRELLEARLGRAVLLSGSGPTLVAVYPSLEAARAAAAVLGEEPPTALRDAIITVTRSHARGGSS
jgi:4-diphosphocytidyl-2-C-methyl-D-erythritol kinase